MRPTRLLSDPLSRARNEPTFGRRTAIVEGGRSYSYSELLDSAERLAMALGERGLARGDRVAIYMENSWSCAVSIFAVSLVGGVLLVVNPQTKADKLAFILEDSGARILLTDGPLSKEFLPALSQIAGEISVIATGAPAATGIERFEDVLRTHAPLKAQSQAIPSDLAALIYTSGSTGHPKGVMQTHQAMVFTLGSLIEYLRLGPDDRILCALPLAFDYGLYQLLMAVHLGATLVLERGFAYPAQVFARMREEEVTVFPGVPTIFSMLLSMHRQRPLRFDGVTRVMNTAAALPESFNTELRSVFPNALLYRMYGLTECKRVSYLEPEMIDDKPGSVGKAIPGTEVFVLDADGQKTKPGEVGILHVRGPHVMLGYWNQPEASARMLRPGPLPGERILCTHDHFRMDEDGYLYFIGRSDDIIKTRGEKVSPAEVENALHSIEGVREAAVVGIPDELLGEAIRAYVVLEPGSPLDAQKIRAGCAARLESFMVPKEILFCERLPTTATGKVSRRALLSSERPDSKVPGATSQAMGARS